jgi:hypothetical protein
MADLPLTAGERVVDVKFTKDTLSVALRDGRTITVPLAWYPRLLNATASQRKNWEFAGGGYGIHWPDVDEDLSTEGLLRGAPAPRPNSGQPADPKLRSILEKSRRQIEETGGIQHDVFWREVNAESRDDTTKGKRVKRRPKK